jgi:iron(III) transport system substrate-binding protein
VQKGDTKMSKLSALRLFLVSWFLLAGNIFYSSMLLAQDASLVQAAKKEGKLIAYTSMDNATLKAIMDLFEERYGIKGSFFRGNTTAVLDRALTEFRAGKVAHDVVITSASPMEFMKNQGLFSRYVSSANQYFDKSVIDPFFGPRYRSVIMGILYNPKLVKQEEAPKSYDDLLDPKWKGKITTSDPSRHTTATEWFASLHLILGSEEKAKAWIKRFATQEPVLVDNLRVSITRIGAGESLVAIGYLHHVFIYGKQGAPLEYVRGLSGYLGEGHYIAPSSKAPHSNAAKLFIDFFLGKESMDIMASQGEFVNREGIYPPLPGAEQVVKKFILAVPLSGQEYAKKMNEYKRIFK